MAVFPFRLSRLRRGFLAFIFPAILGLSSLAPTPAAATVDGGCTLKMGTDQNFRGVGLADLPEGIAAGTLECAGAAPMPIGVWTLIVDPGAKHLGVRDNPLFSTDHTGPLTQLFSASIGAHVRIAVFERTETAHLSLGRNSAGRAGFRRFAAVCEADHHGDPMQCALGKARIKVRVTASDRDRDGALDTNFNEISLYDGATRLQVISFSTDYSLKPESSAADWIGVIGALTDYFDKKPVDGSASR